MPSSAPLRPLILASASPRRRAIMTDLGLTFDVRPVDIDETQQPDEPPRHLAERLAVEKARAAAADLERGLVVGADTIVVLDGEVLGKPVDADEATRHLRRLRGRAHTVITGLAIVDAERGSVVLDSASSHVWMRDLTDDEITTYVASGDPMDKAGAYAVQNRDFNLVARIDGSESNVIGLPKGLLLELLSRSGHVV